MQKELAPAEYAANPDFNFQSNAVIFHIFRGCNISLVKFIATVFSQKFNCAITYPKIGFKALRSISNTF